MRQLLTQVVLPSWFFLNGVKDHFFLQSILVLPMGRILKFLDQSIYLYVFINKHKPEVPKGFGRVTVECDGVTFPFERYTRSCSSYYMAMNSIVSLQLWCKFCLLWLHTFSPLSASPVFPVFIYLYYKNTYMFYLRLCKTDPHPKIL